MSPPPATDEGAFTIDIVMAAYNCAPWVDQTIESIVAQNAAGWHLIARDDRSSDDTNSHLSEWQKKLGGRMTTLPDSGERNLGVTGNFTTLLERTSARWVMSADPDDIWLAGKLQTTCQAMELAESEFGNSTPIAICTDAAVVDGTGRQLAESYWRWSRAGLTHGGRAPRVAMESVALGSTMMMNRALLEIALPIHPGAPYQDWWLALVAAAFGRLIPLPDRTILYRRHGSNATADPYVSNLSRVFRRPSEALVAARQRLQRVLGQSSAIANAFTERYGSRLRPSDRAALESLAKISSMSPLERRIALFQHGLWFGSRLKNIGLLALL